MRILFFTILKVDVKMSSEAGPGDEISLTVSTNPDSYIGLLGVDQRSLLLKSGNDISKVGLYIFKNILFDFDSFKIENKTFISFTGTSGERDEIF